MVNPLDKAITDMKVLYGLQPRINTDLEKVETKNIHSTARETQRVFKKKEIQYSAKHPLIIFITYIYNFISNKIRALFSNKAQIKEKNDILFLANSLKNHGYITQKEFIQLKEAYEEGPESMKGITKKILSELYAKNRIDRKNYYHFTLLADINHQKEVFQFLFAISSVSNINRYQEELKEIVQPLEQLEMIEMLKDAYDYSRFPEASVTAFSTLTARLEIYRWVKEDPRETREKKLLLESLKGKDSKKFETAMCNYLQTKVNVTRGLEKNYYLELMKSFESSKAQNSFIHFSQALESLSVLMDWEKKVTSLETILEEMVQAKVTFDDQKAHQLLEDLKELYNIFGKILENEKEFSASNTAMGLEQGILRTKWRHIGNLINQIAGHKVDNHHMCGCLFDKEQQEAWPDVENTEIRPSNPVYKPDRPAPPADQKKINVLGFYCNWGSGHRSNMQAISEMFGSDEFHFSTVDLPEAVLMPMDTINQIAGGNHSIATLYNTLLAGRYISWINRLFLANNKVKDSDVVKFKTLIREQVLKQRPDIILVNYGGHAPYILEVAQELGIPFMRIHTDMDVIGDALDTYPHAYSHFKKAVPYAIPDMEEYMNGKYSDDQIEITGYMIRPSFYELKKELDKNPGKMAELRKKNNIQDDEVVYAVSSGGCGADNPFPKFLAQTTPGQVPKGHVFFIAGRNKDAAADLKAFLEENKGKLNPDITIHIEGFVSAERMAELQALCSSEANNGTRGLFMGKGGGSTLAELLWMESQVLIDMRDNAQITWEMYAARQLEGKGLASILFNKKDFIQQVNERCSAPKGDYSLFKTHPPDRLYQLVKDMVRDAENDPQFHMKKVAWETNKVFMRGITQKSDGEVLNYFDSLATVNRMIRSIEHKQGLKCSNEMLQWLREKKPVAINFHSMRLVPTETYRKEDSRMAVRYFINQLEHHLQEKKELPESLLQMASLYLDLVHKEHRSELKKGLNTCKKDRFLMEIAYLDRLLASVNLNQTAEEFVKDDKHPYWAVSMLYKTPLAKDQLRTWIREKTARGRNKNIGTETLLSEKDALVSFLYHPDQYNWMMDLKIHRMVSTFNHKLEVNKEGEVMILFNGERKSASQLIQSSLTSIGSRIVDASQGTEYTYHYKNGLQEVSTKTHPDLWQGEIPLFKKKDRNSQDYRLEIITDTQKGEEHAWIRLKHPNGEIYSIGRFWDPDLELPALETTAALPGNLRAGDQHEFKPGKKGENLKITKINLENEKNFEKVKKYIEKLQSDGDMFNIFNKNCASLIHEVCELIDVPVENKVTISEQMIPFPLRLRKIFLLNPWVRDISLILLYPSTLITHLVLGIFGAFKKHTLTSASSRPLFYSVESFFDPTRSLIDSTIQLRAWQECASDRLGNGVLNLGQLRHFAKKISRAKILKSAEG